MKQNDIATVVGNLLPKDTQNRVMVSDRGGEWQEFSHPMKIRSQPIAIGCPMDEVMFGKFWKFYVQLDVMPWDLKLFVGSTYIPEARNRIHNLFLDSDPKRYQHLFMMDSDTVGNYDLIGRLLKWKKPVVAGWYPAKVEDAEKDYPVVYDYSHFDVSNTKYQGGHHVYKRRDKPGMGLEKVDGIGAGCVMMRRDVAEALGRSPYDMNTGGEDLVMCTKLRELGIPIFVDWDLRCRHIGTKEW